MRERLIDFKFILLGKYPMLFNKIGSFSVVEFELNYNRTAAKHQDRVSEWVKKPLKIL